MRTLHLIEPGGRGGVWQHTVEVAVETAATGRRVVVHTASDYEQLDPSIDVCGCYSWLRGIRLRRVRLIAVVARFLLVTLPHLSHASASSLAHVQGQFGWGLYAVTIRVLKLRAHRVVYSPHNTFIRGKHAWQKVLLKWAIEGAQVNVCFAAADAQRLRELGASTVRQMPLVQYAPEPTPALISLWRERLAPSTGLPLFVLAGQIRPDKGIRDFLQASTLAVEPAQFAIVGEDAGFAEEAVKLRAFLDSPAKVHVGYLDMLDFAAVLACADAVVAPYPHASSSGVIALAMQLGTPALAYPVGGLVDSGAMLTQDSSPESLAATMDEAIHRGLSRGMPRSGVQAQPWIGRIYGT